MYQVDAGTSVDCLQDFSCKDSVFQKFMLWVSYMKACLNNVHYFCLTSLVHFIYVFIYLFICPPPELHL